MNSPWKKLELEKPSRISPTFSIIAIYESQSVRREYYFGSFENPPRSQTDKILFWCYEEELAKSVIDSFNKQQSTDVTSKLEDWEHQG